VPGTLRRPRHCWNTRQETADLCQEWGSV